MNHYEYCGECDAYLGHAVWGLFHCPHCEAKLTLPTDLFTEEDELDD